MRSKKYISKKLKKTINLKQREYSNVANSERPNKYTMIICLFSGLCDLPKTSSSSLKKQRRRKRNTHESRPISTTAPANDRL